MPFNLTPIIDQGRRIAADFRFDTYSIVRVTRTPDGEGGWEETPAVVESGGCVLTMGARLPEERALADRIQSTVPVILRNLPYNTSLTAADTVTVNGRTLQVIGVLRAEAANVAATAVCEERS